MPDYNYRCPECDEYHVITMKITEYDGKKIEKCPDCGADMKRSMSAPGVVWKAGGSTRSSF